MKDEKKPSPDEFEQTVRRIRSAKTDPAMRMALVTLLGAGGDSRAVPVLKEVIASGGSASLSANLALARFGRDPEVEAALLDRLAIVTQRWGMSQPNAYFTVIRALGECGGATTASVLVDMLPLVFASCDATHALLSALREIGPEARAALERLRDEGRAKEFVGWAEQLLGSIGEVE